MEPRNTKAEKLLQQTGRNPNIFWDEVKPKQPIGNAADSALKNAKEAGIATLPLITAAGIKMLCGPRGGYIDLSPLGLPIAIGGLVLDTIKAPFCAFVATEEALRGATLKVVSCLFDKAPTQYVIDTIYASFLLRMRDTASILIALGLEQEETLNRKLAAGDIEELVALTLLHTAFASRESWNTIFLASENRLSRENCPEESLKLFDEVMDLKKLIAEAFRLTSASQISNKKEQYAEESRIACNWIALIKAQKTLTKADMPDLTNAQLNIVNQIINKVADLKKISLLILPESPEKVAHYMTTMKK
jgi:hypothetical protein